MILCTARCSILQLLNQRVLEDLKTRWWDYNKTRCPKVEDESDGISIKNIGGVFLVIFIGIGLGLITLGFEYYWYKWRPGLASKKAGEAGDKGNGRAGGGGSAEHNSVGRVNYAYSY